MAMRASRSGGCTSTTRPLRNRLRRRSSIPPSSRGGRSLAMTICRSFWCRWLNVWKNSVCVSSARARNCTSSRSSTSTSRYCRWNWYPRRRGYQFQRQYRDVDVLLLDDVQFLARAEETQTEFFHTFNHLHQNERQIVIASDRPPLELGGIEERLRSRFRSGLVVDVQPPDLETRIAILQLKADRDHVSAPDEVLHFIASKFDSNIRELEGALLRVNAFASISRQPVDLALAERALSDLIPDSGQEITPVVILEETATYFGLERNDLVSKSRSRPPPTSPHTPLG